MANSDYETRAVGAFCPVANLASIVGPLDTTLPLTALKTVGPNDRWVGMCAMVGTELVKVTAINTGNIEVARGCGDTVPAAHPLGTIVWFIDAYIGTDKREYLSGSTVGIKVLPKTTSQSTPLDKSPPQAITFNHRFIRPYPPADCKANGTAVHAADVTIDGTTSLTLSWVHRNRVAQADQLLGHTDAGVAPEAGQVTRVRFYTPANALVATVTSAGNELVYDRSTATVDFGLLAVANTGDFPAYLVLDSTRDGYESWQSYRLDFVIDTNGIAPVGTQRLLEDGTVRRLESGVARILES